MSHVTFRVNLSASVFPFATELWGRSIMVPQNDENFEKSVVSPSDLAKDKGIPQAFYMHNVIPTAQGYQAIGYDLLANPFPGSASDFNSAFFLQNSNGNRFIFVPANGRNYIFDKSQGGWLSFPFAANVVSPISPPLVTTAFINGQSYIFYEGLGCYIYNDAALSFDPVALAGLTVANITGLCAANGYMIAFSKSAHPAILYSNSSNPLDFAPSLITGAGGTDVQAISGTIVACLPIAGGFMIYCTKNVVAAVYTNNAQVPYNFDEVKGSGGISDPEQVSWEANLGEHHVWSNYGLQSLSLLTGAQDEFPELTHFLAGKLFEDFDEVSNTFSQTYLDNPLFTKLTVIENSYMILSYGVAQGLFTHAIVYDMNIARFGKCKINHIDCFQWNNPGSLGPITYGSLGQQTYASLGNLTYGQLLNLPPAPASARTTLAFLQSDGTVYRANLDFAETNTTGAPAAGVLLLGKYQYVRNQWYEHQWTDVENIRSALNFQMYLLPTLDGKTFLPAVTPTLIHQSPNSRRYASWTTGMNMSFLFKGAFNLTSILTDFTLGGDFNGF